MEKLEDDQAKRVYEAILSGTPDLAYVFDLNYRFKYANHALLTMWGKSWENAVGKGLRENGYEEWHALMHEREIDHVAATGDSVRGEVSFPHAVLGRRVYDYILIPVFDAQGKVEAVAGTTRDISDMKHAQDALQESEERFRNLVVQAPTAMAVFRGPNLVAEIANAEYLNMIDKKASEFLNIPLYESLPSVRPAIESIVNNVMQTGKIFRANEFEVMLHRHGALEPAYVNFTYSPLYSKSGIIDGFMVVANEVTAQVIARRKVEATSAALANAIELAELGTWNMDEKGYMIVSRRYADMHGLDSLELPIETFLETVLESDRDAVRQKLRLATQSKDGRFDAEYRVGNSQAGIELIVHAIGQPFFDASGKLRGFEGTAQDVTTQRAVQLALENEVQTRTEELQATNEELATTNEELSESSSMLIRSNEELSRFAYVASHDLQEPVRKISVFVELLEKSITSLDDKSRTYLSKIDESATRMLNLIRDVLSHSQLSTKRSSFDKVDLNKVLADTMLTFELLIQERQGVIKSHPLPHIDGIDIQMHQLFTNLFSNALKFSSRERPLVLEIKAEKVTSKDLPAYPLTSAQINYYRITFTDNGIGFDQAYASQIFEIFQRLHSRNEYSGTGIGLATVKKIVENHRGFISASSKKDQGATFTIILPETQI